MVKMLGRRRAPVDTNTHTKKQKARRGALSLLDETQVLHGAHERGCELAAEVRAGESREHVVPGCERGHPSCPAKAIRHVLHVHRLVDDLEPCKLELLRALRRLVEVAQAASVLHAALPLH